MPERILRFRCGLCDELHAREIDGYVCESRIRPFSLKAGEIFSLVGWSGKQQMTICGSIHEEKPRGHWPSCHGFRGFPPSDGDAEVHGPRALRCYGPDLSLPYGSRAHDLDLGTFKAPPLLDHPAYVMLEQALSEDLSKDGSDETPFSSLGEPHWQAKTYCARALNHKIHGKGQPYIVHPAHVVAVLDRYEVYDPEVVDAAWLHDTVEDDEETTRERLESEFTPRTAELVWRVSNEPGYDNRAARHEATHPKIAEDHDATQLKVADRIANMEVCVATGDLRAVMYRKEHQVFQRDLRYQEWNRAHGYRHRYSDLEPMWLHLDRLMSGDLD